MVMKNGNEDALPLTQSISVNAAVVSSLTRVVFKSCVHVSYDFCNMFGITKIN